MRDNMINENEHSTLVAFPVNKESFERLDDPLKQLKNEFLPENEPVITPELMGCENVGNTLQGLGQLELFNKLQEQIKDISEHHEHISYLIDEIDMYLPRKR